MTYRDTARAFAQAESNNHPAFGGQAAETLPMSDWAEARRAQMTPQTIANNHAIHVSDTAQVLRDALAWREDDSGEGGGIVLGGMAVAEAAYELLAAIGEGE